VTDPKDAQRLQLEADLTSFRILELRLAPVVGDFDVAHLQKIHRRIFQDLPSVGFSDVKPGEFRPPVDAGVTWMKHRVLESTSCSDLQLKQVGPAFEAILGQD
jgi:cell filamentation protein